MAGRRVTREQVLAFRAVARSLDRRRPGTELLDCGIQDTPPGNADVTLGARLDVDVPVGAEAVAKKELVLTWSLPGAPHVFSPKDFAVFTLGARPADGTLEALWGQPEHSLVEVEQAMVAVIGSEARPKGEVSAAVTTSVPAASPTPWCRCRGKGRGPCSRRTSTPWTSHRRPPRASPRQGRLHPAPGPRRPLPRSRQPQGVFPILGGPGVVLHEALPVATWRRAAKGRRYEVTVGPFAMLSA